MKCRNWPIAVCSWSLQTDIAGVADAMAKIGIEHVHLGIRPAVEDPNLIGQMQQQDWKITCTMIDFPQEDYSTLDTIKATGGVVPDECWDRNRVLFAGAVDVTAKLGVKYLSMHAGFIDESDPAYAQKIHDRIKTLADLAAEKNVMFLLETGQETADELKSLLEKLDHPAVAVNFDPANMILYGKGDPIEAVHTLGPWIKHIHIKDGQPSDQPGVTWGMEVPWGTGRVGAAAFLDALEKVGYEGAVAIEREAGDDRFGDIKRAAEALSS